MRWLCIVNTHGIELLKRAPPTIELPDASQIGVLFAVHAHSAMLPFTVQTITTTEMLGKITVKSLYVSSEHVFTIFVGDTAADFNEALSEIVSTHIITNCIALITALIGAPSYRDTHNDNVELYKRKLRVVGDVIDAMLSTTNSVSHSSDVTVGLLLNVPQLTLIDHLTTTTTNEAPLLGGLLSKLSLSQRGKRSSVRNSTRLVIRKAIEDFAAECGTTEVVLFINGAIYTATHEWWKKSTQELAFLSTWLSCCPSSTARDIPIHPLLEPDQTNRFVSVLLTRGVELCLFLGPVPSLHTILDKIAVQYMQPHIHTLRQLAETSASLAVYKRSLLGFDSRLLGVIYVNRNREKPFYSYELFITDNSAESVGSHLADFYAHTAAKVFRVRQLEESLLSNRLILSRDSLSPHHTVDNSNPTNTANRSRGASECYLHEKEFTLFAVNREVQSCEIYCIYHGVIPMQSCMALTIDTLSRITARRPQQEVV